MTDKTIGGCVRTSFAGGLRQESSSVEGKRPSGDREDPGDVRPQHWRRLWESFAQSAAKMSTPSKSCSSAREDEGYFEWREAMERRQLESERQMQALLQETTRLREENVVLRIQALSSGPPRDQRSRGQGANSRPDLESIYLGTAGVIPDVHNDQSRERPMPTY